MRGVCALKHLARSKQRGYFKSSACYEGYEGWGIEEFYSRNVTSFILSIPVRFTRVVCHH